MRFCYSVQFGAIRCNSVHFSRYQKQRPSKVGKMLNGGPMFIKHNMYLYILRYVLITVLVLMSNMDCISTYLMTFFRLTIWRKTRADSTPSCFWWRISISFTWEHDIFSHFYCGVFGGSSEIRWTLKGKSFIIVRASCLVHLVRTYTLRSFAFWSNNNMYLQFV